MYSGAGGSGSSVGGGAAVSSGAGVSAGGGGVGVAQAVSSRPINATTPTMRNHLAFSDIGLLLLIPIVHVVEALHIDTGWSVEPSHHLLSVTTW
jgi:hypothetical protein